jgi:hypothetical protein
MANDMGYAGYGTANYKDPITVSLIQQINDNVTAIANLLNAYRTEANVAYSSAGGVIVSTGSVMINGKLRRNTDNESVTWASTGGNGVVEAASTGVYVWAVASGSTSTFNTTINFTSTTHTGNANARLIGYFYNGADSNIDQSSVHSILGQEHHNLSGLTDNDHPQYVRGSTGMHKMDLGVIAAFDGLDTAVFSFTFASAPYVFCGEWDPAGGFGYAIHIKSVSTTVAVFEGENTAQPLHWMAIGTPA